MPTNRLFIFVEGDDDKRFIERVVVSELALKSPSTKIIIVPYANEPKKKISKYIKAIEQRGDEYIFLCDINSCRCVTAKKNKLLKQRRALKDDKIMVVIKMIEGWYLAGLSVASLSKLKINFSGQTDQVNKDSFLRLKPRNYPSVTAYKIDVLSKFSHSTARQKNASYDYFYRKYLL